MCGLVGVAGDLALSVKRKIFENLLTVDVVRGVHSTGAGMVARWKDEGMAICKTVGPPHELFGLAEYHAMMKKSAKVYIGHNRYATTGKVTDENAHPFLFDNIVGAHNGTLEGMARNKLFESHKYGTDSEAIFSHINKYGFDKTMEIVHNPTYSSNAWALTYYNAQENTINLCRNAKRPLFYVYSKDMMSLFWASEIDMLKWVLRRNHVDIFEENSYQLAEDHHYSWKIPDSVMDKFELPTVKKIERPAPIVPEFTFQQTNHDTVTYWDPSKQRMVTVPRASSTSYAASTDAHKSNVIQILDKRKKERLSINTKKWKPPYKDHNGIPIGKSKIRDKLVGGCTFCPSHKNEGFADKFEWGDFIFFCKPDTDGRSVFLCEDCYNDEGIRNLCKELI